MDQEENPLRIYAPQEVASEQEMLDHLTPVYDKYIKELMNTYSITTNSEPDNQRLGVAILARFHNRFVNFVREEVRQMTLLVSALNKENFVRNLPDGEVARESVYCQTHRVGRPLGSRGRGRGRGGGGLRGRGRGGRKVEESEYESSGSRSVDKKSDSSIESLGKREIKNQDGDPNSAQLSNGHKRLKQNSSIKQLDHKKKKKLETKIEDEDQRNHLVGVIQRSFITQQDYSPTDLEMLKEPPVSIFKNDANNIFIIYPRSIFISNDNKCKKIIDLDKFIDINSADKCTLESMVGLFKHENARYICCSVKTYKHYELLIFRHGGPAGEAHLVYKTDLKLTIPAACIANNQVVVAKAKALIHLNWLNMITNENVIVDNKLQRHHLHEFFGDISDILLVDDSIYIVCHHVPKLFKLPVSALRDHFYKNVAEYDIQEKKLVEATSTYRETYFRNPIIKTIKDYVLILVPNRLFLCTKDLVVKDQRKVKNAIDIDFVSVDDYIYGIGIDKYTTCTLLLIYYDAITVFQKEYNIYTNDIEQEQYFIKRVGDDKFMISGKEQKISLFNYYIEKGNNALTEGDMGVKEGIIGENKV